MEFRVPPRPAPLDDDGLSLDRAELAQPVGNGLGGRRKSSPKDTDAKDSATGLRQDAGRLQETCRSDTKSKSSPVHHPILPYSLGSTGPLCPDSDGRSVSDLFCSRRSGPDQQTVHKWPTVQSNLHPGRSVHATFRTWAERPLWMGPPDGPVTERNLLPDPGRRCSSEKALGFARACLMAS